MACTTNNTIKPDVLQRPSNFYGAPQGESSRIFNSVDYGVQGIVLHCTDMTISQYVQYLACLSQTISGVKQEVNHHYSIGSSGALNQHIDDGNISWTFGAYTAAAYVTPPSPTITIDWPALQTINGANVSPDVYVINILIAKSYNQSTGCLTSTGLPSDQHEKLVQLLAYLSATYDIPLDADHINWHDNIATQTCPSNECTCVDIACLLTDINTFCEEDCNTVTYSEVDCDSVSHLLALPNDCGNSGNCIVSVPFDACCFGHLANEGDIDIFLGLSSTSDDPYTTDAEYCLVKNFINVSSPLTGKGTADDPLVLDLCLFGDFVPDGEPVSLLGIDTEGCLVEKNLVDIIAENETPIIAVDTNSIDLTVSGTSDHTLQADVKVSTENGNLLEIASDGLFVSFECNDLKALFEEDTLQYIYGVDVQGECAFEDVTTLVNNVVCNSSVSDEELPLYLLGRNVLMECPVFFSPAQIVEAGLVTEDTSSINLATAGGITLSAVVNVDPATDNTLQITSEGLYVPQLIPNALDDCISVDIVGEQLNVGINIDPAVDNILTCQPDGLYVPDLIVSDTSCVDLTYINNTRTLSANLVFSGTIDDVPNVASCENGGLYIPQGANIAIQEPLVGSGSNNDPLDINFSLLDNQDLCDLGGVIPQTLSMVTIVGRDVTGCLRQYTGEEFINQFLEINNGDCITTTLIGNVLNVEPIISPTIGGINNTLFCTNTGLYVPVGAGIVPQETNCIALQLVNGILTATPILDPNELNQLSCNVDGLYVERGAGVIGDTTDCIQVVVIDGQVAATPIISGAILGIANVLSCEASGLFVPIGAGITPVTTDCLTVAFDTGTGELTIEPIISPLVDNILECTANGLYVPNGFIQAVTTTDCIELAVVGNELTATPVIDPDVDNLLECRTTGLFANFAVLDTFCIDLTLENGVLSATPIVDPVSANLLTCGANGLLVELNSDVFIDSNCLNFDVVNGLVTVNPILAPDQGPITNILRCLSDGLYVPVGGGITTLNGNCIELELIAGVLTADVIIDTVTPDNAITCGPDGLYVPICCPQVQDTTTVNLTLIDPRTITADVIIDPDGTNILVSNPNGLYVPPNFITAVVDSNCIDIEVVGGVMTINPVISATVDNQLQCLADGFYVPDCCPNVTDTTTVDLTLTGTNEISANVIVDPDPTNALVANPNGLYVPEDLIQAVNDTQCIALDTTGNVLTATPIINPIIGNLLTCGVNGLSVTITAVDTNCIDVELVGGVLTINPILSPTPDNALECLGDGLYVPQGANAVGADTDCISVDVTSGVVTATPIISPNTNNRLTCELNGLYVAEEFIINITNSDCIDLSVNSGVLEAEISISSTPDNQIQCFGDGLYVPIGAGATGIDTNCLSTTIVNGVVSVDPIIDPALDNQLQCLVTGLYVPEPAVTAVADTQCIDLEIVAGVLTATPIIDPAVDNVLTCGANGLYTPTLAVVDTDCIDLEMVGNTLTATLIVDPAADNLLICNAGQGAYVPPLTAVDSNCIDLDVTNNILTANVVISALGDNTIQCVTDGLYVPECCPLVQDTLSVDLTLTGTRTISADVIIDPAADNQLVLNPTGLYVPESFVTTAIDTDCIDIDVTNGVLTATAIIDPAIDNRLVCQGTGLYVPPLTIVDGNCVDLSLVGDTLTAEVIVSGQANNIVQCVADGLFAEAPVISVDNTNCITLTLNTGVLTADPVIDPTLDNQLSCGANGLYVPEPFITAINDTNCIALTDTAGVLTADPIIDPAATNLLTCGANGLLVEHVITTVDSNCIDLDLTGNVLTADVIISVQANNIVQCIGDGLFAEAPVRTVADTNCITLTLTAGQLTAEPIIDPNIDNQLQCLATGLFVNEPFVTAVNDTNCITLNVTGGVLTADPILSTIANNQIQCVADGLYVPVGAGVTGDITDCIDVDVTAGVVTATPIISGIIGGISNTLTCEATGLYVPELQIDDTDCIDLDYTGDVLTATPILAPDQAGITNVLTCIAGQGLYVPAGGGLTVLDNDCIDLTLTNGNVLEAEVIIDPSATNILECGATGLLVDFNVVDTDCIDLTFAGGILSAEPIIAPGPIGGCNNALVCDATGLFVPELEVLDTNCIDLTLTDGCILSADPIISPDDCNGLECRANGLYVNNDIRGYRIRSVADPDNQIFALGTFPAVFTQFGEPIGAEITNESPCNDLMVNRTFEGSSFLFDNSCGVNTATIIIEHQFSTVGPGGPWGAYNYTTVDVGPGEAISITHPVTSAAFILAPGASAGLWTRIVFANPDGNFCGEVDFASRGMLISAVSFIN